MSDMLEELGHEVAGLACSIDEAMSQLDSIDPAADAAVLDAELRGVSSAPVAQRLRLAGIPFVITSGHSGELLDRIGTVEPRLPKPVDEARLKQTLAQLLS
ncbi:MAG: response regulator [Hyphomicrobiaceae bacterium]